MDLFRSSSVNGRFLLRGRPVRRVSDAPEVRREGPSVGVSVSKTS